MTSRSYVVRVWGKSVKIGQIATTEDLERLCVTYFQGSKIALPRFGKILRKISEFQFQKKSKNLPENPSELEIAQPYRCQMSISERFSLTF